MTIKHIVLWKVGATDPEIKAEQVGEIRRRLLELDGVVPSIRKIEVEPNGVDITGNWDVAIVSEFDDADALRAYIEHPAHQEVVGYVRSVVVERAAIDLEV